MAGERTRSDGPGNVGDRKRGKGGGGGARRRTWVIYTKGGRIDRPTDRCMGRVDRPPDLQNDVQDVRSRCITISYYSYTNFT